MTNISEKNVRINKNGDFNQGDLIRLNNANGTIKTVDLPSDPKGPSVRVTLENYNSLETSSQTSSEISERPATFHP